MARLNVLLSSGYVGEKAKSELVRSGFAFISKPYRPAELASKLAECLRADRLPLPRSAAQVSAAR